MDAKEISKKVRDYFFEVHGQFAVVAFRIEEVTFSEKKREWEIKCSFLPTVMATEADRAGYLIIVDFDGKIKKANRFDKSQKITGMLKKA